MGWFLHVGFLLPTSLLPLARLLSRAGRKTLLSAHARSVQDRQAGGQQLPPHFRIGQKACNIVLLFSFLVESTSGSGTVRSPSSQRPSPKPPLFSPMAQSMYMDHPACGLQHSGFKDCSWSIYAWCQKRHSSLPFPLPCPTLPPGDWGGSFSMHRCKVTLEGSPVYSRMPDSERERTTKPLLFSKAPS